MDGLTQHTKVVYQQARDIAASQLELRNETIEIENEIDKLGGVVSSKMSDLQKTADDIENITGISLGRQQELLDGQSTALDGLRFLTEFQSNALEESRNTLQELAEYGRRQQEELLKRQEQLQQVHDRLVENSKTILETQVSIHQSSTILKKFIS